MTIRTAADNKSTILQVAGVDKLKINDTGVVEADYFKTPAGVLSPVGAFRNKIINGDFSVWQRGTSQTAQGYGSADRWELRYADTTSPQVLRYETLGGNPATAEGLKYFARISGIVGSNGYIVYRQFIEGVDTYAGKRVTVRLWARSSAGNKVGIRLTQYFGTGGSPSPEVVQSKLIELPGSGGAWSLIEAQFDLASVVGKTLGTDANDALIVSIDKGMSGTSVSSSGYAEAFGTSGYTDVAGIQLEEGTYATPFEQRFITIEEALCERYYSTGELSGSIYATNTTTELLRVQVRYRQIMRAIPVVSLSYMAGNVGTFTVYRNNTKGFNAHFSKSGADPYIGALYSYRADAEISI